MVLWMLRKFQGKSCAKWSKLLGVLTSNAEIANFIRTIIVNIKLRVDIHMISMVL